jgi:hypothetical protein
MKSNISSWWEFRIPCHLQRLDVILILLLLLSSCLLYVQNLATFHLPEPTGARCT